MKRLREWVDGLPTHRWVGRLVLLLAVWRFYSDGFNFDSFVLMYLWWLSEVTAYESWLARRLAEQADNDGPHP